MLGVCEQKRAQRGGNLSANLGVDISLAVEELGKQRGIGFDDVQPRGEKARQNVHARESNGLVGRADESFEARNDVDEHIRRNSVDGNEQLGNVLVVL
ncbi:hypothetical protein FGB62_45g179 [Gracilaria domingensis]|nr:hypothetical protein FGB62_45g179 [Gracilaria domingensis]